MHHDDRPQIVSPPRPGTSRRDFLRRSVFGATACLTLPSFLGNGLFALDARADSAPPTGKDGPIVVIVQLGGGNDSLNTVIPYQNPLYYSARPNLAVPQASVLNLDGQIGLHPAMTALKGLWDEGGLAIVNGVGYPNPNLSHFTGTDNWNTAEPGKPVRDGWLGRYFDHQCSGRPPTVGFETSDTATLAFKGSALGVSVGTPARFNWQNPGTAAAANLDPAMVNLQHQLIKLDRPWDSGLGKDALAYVQRQAHNALVSSADVQGVLAGATSANGFPHAAFPKSFLGSELQNVAALISGNLDTTVYYVHAGGFDTHQNEVLVTNGVADPTKGTHAGLMADLSNSIAAFAAEMKAQGKWDRVLLFTFSEFGRKLIENGTHGTDHGAAASLFVAGGRVKAGTYGRIPDLAASALVSDHSLVFNVDFRSVYATVLQNWLGVPASAMGDVLPGAAGVPLLGFV